MKIKFDHNYNYKVIEICCSEMGKLVMDNIIQCHPHTNRFPEFYITTYLKAMDISLKNCPYCGEKIMVELIEDTGDTSHD